MSRYELFLYILSIIYQLVFPGAVGIIIFLILSIPTSDVMFLLAAGNAGNRYQCELDLAPELAKIN